MLYVSKLPRGRAQRVSPFRSCRGSSRDPARRFRCIRLGGRNTVSPRAIEHILAAPSLSPPGSVTSRASALGYAPAGFLAHQRIEQQLERPVGLRAVLRAEPDEHYLALPVLRRHHRRLFRQVLLAHEPSALEDVAVRIGGDDLVVVV